jgi:aspartyl-tRNA(Asn)/glutamyl-tRNA(Gln) amidotransferase subunit C
MSAPFSEADLRRLADLAQLELDDQEAHAFADQLSAILTYAQELQAVNTSGVTPTTHALAELGELRADVVAPSLDLAAALANAPEPALPQGLFKVPHVLPQS